MPDAIYKFHFDCGRQGSLNGVFVADTKDVDDLIEKRTELYFGEVLGKHSEIYGHLDKEDVTLVTEDPAVVALFLEHDLATGYNPFSYLPEDEEE